MKKKKKKKTFMKCSRPRTTKQEANQRENNTDLTKKI